MLHLPNPLLCRGWGSKTRVPLTLALGVGRGTSWPDPPICVGGPPITWVFPACRQHPHHQSPKLRAPCWLWSQTPRRHVWLLHRGSGLTFSSLYFHRRVKKSQVPHLHQEVCSHWRDHLTYSRLQRSRSCGWTTGSRREAPHPPLKGQGRAF